ncbi:MAG: glycosyltransferase [candidate division KSB1 bacterium]
MKILFLAHRIPFPPDKGDKIRSYQVLQYLAARHEVYLACLIDNQRDMQAAEELRRTLPHLVYERLRPISQRWRMITALWRQKPLTVSYFYLPRLQQQLDALMARERFDALFVYSSTMAEYVRTCNIPLRVMDFCDLDSQKFKQYARVSAPPFSWLYRFEGNRLAAYEREAAQYFEHVLFINSEEQRLFEQNRGGKNTVLMSNGVDFARYENSPLEGGQGGVVQNDEADKSYHEKNTPLTPLQGGISRSATSHPYLAFTGAMDYLPNIDAAFWCAREIFPLLRASLPELEFYIIGGNPSRKIRKLHDPQRGIHVTGYLPDLRPLLKGASVFIAPMRIARGMQTKILEAMACGVPVVTSAQAAAGIGARVEEELLIADTAGDYARQTLRLLRNDEERERLRRNAQTFLRAHFDWEKNLAVLENLLEGAR